MFIALILVCSMSTTAPSSACNVENATEVAQMQKGFSTKKECLLNGRRFGPTILVRPMTPIEDRMTVVCAKTLSSARRGLGPKPIPQSLRDALRDSERLIKEPFCELQLTPEREAHAFTLYVSNSDGANFIAGCGTSSATQLLFLQRWQSRAPRARSGEIRRPLRRRRQVADRHRGQLVHFNPREGGVRL